MTALPPPGVLGFRVKSGWAAGVLLAGSPKAPHVVSSRIVELSDPAVPHARQPYHAGMGTAQTDTDQIDRLVRGIERFARNRIAAAVKASRREHRVRGAGIVVPSLTDPASIASPHMRAHASEGQLFRSVTAAGLERCHIPVRVVLERDVYEELAQKLRQRQALIKARVAALGERIAPWRAEQKVAAAAAWLILAG